MAASTLKQIQQRLPARQKATEILQIWGNIRFYNIHIHETYFSLRICTQTTHVHM